MRTVTVKVTDEAYDTLTVYVTAPPDAPGMLRKLVFKDGEVVAQEDTSLAGMRATSVQNDPPVNAGMRLSAAENDPVVDGDS